jgi:hypothetical protein
LDEGATGLRITVVSGAMNRSVSFLILSLDVGVVFQQNFDNINLRVPLDRLQEWRSGAAAIADSDYRFGEFIG